MQEANCARPRGAVSPAITSDGAIMTRAFVFPGQGSQTVGMGKALAEASAAAREVFEEVDEALERRLSAIMWDGPSDALTETANAQPALMAHSIAVVRVLKAEAGVDVGDAVFVAGHSLGEYSALCASGALSLRETARLLRVRGEAMQAAAERSEGAMAALLGADVSAAEAVIAEARRDGPIQIANDNAPGQIVISGAVAAVETACAAAKSHGAKLARRLPVSGAFHSELMAPAAERMERALSEAAIAPPRPPLVANVTATQTAEVEEIRRNLVDQVTGRVRWTESVDYMAAKGCETLIEVGAGKVLSGLNRRIAPDVRVESIAGPDDIEAFLRA